jgi:hypothetical protein
MKRPALLLTFLLCTVLAPAAPPGASPPRGIAPPAFPPPIASYAIDVTLDTEAMTLTAHETITYLNSSAEAIPDLVFHLYLNAFRSADSIFLRESGTVHRGYGWDAEHPGWIEVSSARLGDGTPLQVVEIEDGTLARADLPTPLLPGETLTVELDFRAGLPRVFARTGYADDFVMVGQWFPKLGVWEDGGWNAYPFHANAEFYADFGTYDVAITLPATYLTGATGMPVDVTEHGDGTQTVRYRAEGVIDFVWTASPRFRQAARQVDGVELLYLYLPEHAWSVERVLAAAEAALRLYSEWYGPYPYPRLTVVDVPDEGEGAGGMEYPTLFAAGTMSLLGLEAAGRAGIERSLETVVVHELAHQWWQSMVAFNEAEEPWLDEGLTDYSAVRVMTAVYGADTSMLDAGGWEAGYFDTRRMEYMLTPAVPMYGKAWDFSMIEYGIAAYSKPVLALTTLERILGEETMRQILRTFFERYRFSHPRTEDFRAVAEEVSGEDLSWFFDGLVYGNGVVNYAVTAIDAHQVTVVRQGSLVIPTEIEVTFADGSTLLQPWDGQEATFTLTYPERSLLRAQIDPQRKIVIDLQWSDNGLSRRPDLWAWLALVTRLLYRLQGGLLNWGGL